MVVGRSARTNQTYHYLPVIRSPIPNPSQTDRNCHVTGVQPPTRNLAGFSRSVRVAAYRYQSTLSVRRLATGQTIRHRESRFRKLLHKQTSSQHRRKDMHPSVQACGLGLLSTSATSDQYKPQNTIRTDTISDARRGRRQIMARVPDKLITRMAMTPSTLECRKRGLPRTPKLRLCARSGGAGKGARLCRGHCAGTWYVVACGIDNHLRQRPCLVFRFTAMSGRGMLQPAGMRCAAVQTIIPRGLQWLAGRQVTFPVPKDFPGIAAVSVRKEIQIE